MTKYKHRMTLVVPKFLMSAANQLALIAGESPDDDKTFTQASYQDTSGNLYAVCSAVIKPIVLSMFGKSVEDSELYDDNADVDLANLAMSKAVMYSDGMSANSKRIIIGIDIEPFDMFSALGLTQILEQ